MKSLFMPLILVLLFCLTVSGTSASTNIEEIRGLPPGEQYRQLSLVLMIYGGAEPPLIEAMSPQSEVGLTDERNSFDPDVYKTPLTRIVDQESMLNGAGALLRFAQDSSPAMQKS